MKAPHISTKQHLSRRAFLRGAGVSLSLPWLEAMVPAFATRAQTASATTSPRRLLAMNYSFGFYGPHLFPKETGTGYELTPYLEILKAQRSNFTVISGLSHDEQNGANGHTSELTWLTSARHPGLPGFRNTISFDQFLVEKLAPDTRYSSLILNVGDKGDSMSWTAKGVNLPAENSPSKVFQLLFVDGTSAEVQAQVRDLKRGRSILDTVRGEAKKFQRDLGKRDQEKFDQYLTSVRELESRLLSSESWATRPKPQVKATPPSDVEDRADIVARTRLMHDLMVLAFQSDSTRFISYKAGGFSTAKIDGVASDWHNLTHHGQSATKIDDLTMIEKAEMTEINRLLGLLQGAREANHTLLDQTIVLAGSNLGNASSHSARDLPVILAGGGFKHGQHIAAGGMGLANTRFCNLFVQIGQRLGVEVERFGSSTNASIKGLETV